MGYNFSDNFDGQVDGYNADQDVDLVVIPENGFTGKSVKDGMQLFLKNECAASKKVAIATGGLRTRRSYTDSTSTSTTAPVVEVFDSVTELKRFEAAIDAVICDGVAGNGIIHTDNSKTIKVIPKKGTIQHFIDYINETPVLVGQIKVSTNKTAMFDGAIESLQINPFNATKRDSLELAPFYRADQQQSFILVENANLLLSSETIVYVELPAESETTLTFYPLAFLSGHAGLKNRKKIAGI